MHFGPIHADVLLFLKSLPSPGPPPVLSRKPGECVKKRRASEADLDTPLCRVARCRLVGGQAQQIRGMDNRRTLLPSSPDSTLGQVETISSPLSQVKTISSPLQQLVPHGEQDNVVLLDDSIDGTFMPWVLGHISYQFGKDT